MLTPNEEALSRLISIRASGFVNFRFTSAIWNTGLSLTFCIKAGKYSCSFSKLVACKTYCTGIPARRPPKVDCCWTKARASVLPRTFFDSTSAISICERSRSLMSGSKMVIYPLLLFARTVRACRSGASVSAMAATWSVKSRMNSKVAPSCARILIEMDERSSNGESSERMVRQK